MKKKVQFWTTEELDHRLEAAVAADPTGKGKSAFIREALDAYLPGNKEHGPKKVGRAQVERS